MDDSRFEFRGDLASTPVPEALFTIHRYRVPGVLTVARGGTEKRIFVWAGAVVFAASNDRQDSLGEYLVRAGRISREDHDRTVSDLVSAAGTRRHGALLVEAGLIDPREMAEAVSGQVRSVVFSVFDWDEGTVTFRAGQYATEELVRLNLPTRRTILEGVKATSDVKKVVSRIGPSWSVYESGPAPPDFADIGLSDDEVGFLNRVDGSRTVKELVGLGPSDPGGNVRLLYAFSVLKLISKRDLTARGGIRKIQWRTGGEEPPGES